ncbi:methanogenesis marker 1 protein [Sphaerisporangium album]|uniref:Methanogenesis marker 1 protein n=1 Tax=Sphaerisporangium album TaxID=509200 RepID=A0A367F892_9ACTN|nr:YcaO-like family protein [Sphaerisporangium album]RCG26481.1 methanogenesis marker 1 protein [Sphaerisporangium album]
MTDTTLSMPASAGRSHWFPPGDRAPATACGTSLRTRPLEETEALATAFLSRCGITRISDITDLDVLGIPVFHSTRPGAAAGLNTVTSGKGVTRRAAKVSAMMEAIERTWCEPPTGRQPRRASYAELRREDIPVLDPRRLILRRGHTWHEDAVLGWWPTRELSSDIEVLVPALAIFTPYPPECDMFRSNTIGLAIGNSPQEALLHGLLEAVEQDCTAFGETLKRGGRIRPGSLPDGPAKLAARFREMGVNVQLFGYVNEIGVPTVFATADDTHAEDGMLINGGAGCHLDPVVAATRALTEAAQSRLNVIGGAREDLDSQAYRRHASYEAMRDMLRVWSDGRPEMDFAELPSAGTGRIDGDLDVVLSGLRGIGLDLVLATELAPHDLPFSVTKVVVPGLENYHNDPLRLGARLRREMVRDGLVRSLS